MEQGSFNGICNRGVCEEKPAIYYNHSTRKYYCPGCASIINEWNHQEAMVKYGHELCTKGENKE